MKDEHVKSLLDGHSLRFKIVKALNLNKTCIFNEYGPTAVAHSLQDWLPHYKDTSNNQKQLAEISYTQVRLSTADIGCFAMTRL